MKYEAQLATALSLLPAAKNILILLSNNPSVDHLASGLALYLSLQQAGKNPAIVTEGVIKVGHTNLFGVGDIQNKLPSGSGGDFIITLGGVVDSNGKIPAVEKMDYFPAGNDLNLVFKVLPGQKFEPTSITPHVEGGSFDLIFTIGVSSLENLGSLYGNNQQFFSGKQIINLDNQPANTQFGAVNIVDVNCSLSEVLTQVMSDLHLSIDGDIATNLLTGIFTITNNLQTGNITADTYESVALAVRAGGQKPLIASPTAQIQPVPVMESVSTQPVSQPGFDLSKVFQIPSTPIAESADNFTMPPVVSSSVEQKTDFQPSPEETPMGEGVENASPEADWLTPKIFKGGKGSLN